MRKPVVYYRVACFAPLVNTPMIVAGVKGHSRVRGDLVLTSPVVRVGEGGEFETENTIYRWMPNIQSS